MKNFSKVLLFLFLLGLIIYPVSAKTIEFQEKYQDSNGNWLNENPANLALFPRYTVTQDSTTYTVTRFNQTVTLPKRTWISYNFYPDRIVPVITIDSYSQINSLVTKVNESAWYLTVPFSASNVISVTDNLIDMGVFRRTTSISVRDSAAKSYIILPKVIGGDIRLYFNPVDYSSAVYPLILTENTITVNNATTSGFTSANISLNGSRWTDSGQLAINLNASYLNGLVGYWSMDETTGTTIHNVNTESGLVNATNQGTWNGNTTLNSTAGVIGNAGNFDGVNDYISLNPIPSADSDDNYTYSLWLYTTNTSIYPVLLNNPTGNRNIITANNSVVRAGFYDGVNTYGVSGSYSPGWVHVVYIKIVNNTYLYLNNVLQNGTTKPTYYTNNNVMYIGRAQTFYNKIVVDEVQMWERALTPPEIAELYNRSMRTQAMPVISNQSAAAGNVINRTRITYSGQDSINNISIYARQNGTTNYDLIQANATSGTWYNITNQYQVMDFGLMMSGNGSNTPFFESLEYDEYIIATGAADTNTWESDTQALDLWIDISGVLKLTIFGLVLSFIFIVIQFGVTNKTAGQLITIALGIIALIVIYSIIGIVGGLLSELV